MPPEPGHDLEIHLSALLAERNMTVAELAEKVGLTPVNVSVLKNGRAKAIRFSTLSKLCAVLDCQPGDLITYRVGVAEERR